MKALVTGGAGFIGSTLVDALVARGDIVTVVDDLSRGKRENVNPAADFVQYDIVDPALGEVVHRARPDVVFHLAAQIDVRRSVAEPLVDTRINVVGTVNVLAACAAAGVRRVVFASSGGAIYGDAATLPTPEICIPAPRSAYGAAKFSGELYGGVFHSLHGLEFVALRFGNVYGPRQDPHGEAGVVAIFAQKLLSDVVPTIYGNGTQTRDYVYVDDVVHANLLAATSPSIGAYNVGTGIATDVNELYTAIARSCGVKVDAQYGPAKPGEQMTSCLDTTKARDELQWQPQVTLVDGVTRTVDYFRKN